MQAVECAKGRFDGDSGARSLSSVASSAEMDKAGSNFACNNDTLVYIVAPKWRKESPMFEVIPAPRSVGLFEIWTTA